MMGIVLTVVAAEVEAGMAVLLARLLLGGGCGVAAELPAQVAE